MAELNINGRMSVKNLKKQFKEAFGASLRVYNGDELADDDARLASIRTSSAKGGELSVRGNMQVGNFEKKMHEIYGISVQVADAADTQLVSDDVTIASITRLANDEPAGTSESQVEDAAPTAVQPESPIAVPAVDIERLIEAALLDGVVTDKERAILIKRATAQGIDPDEFEMVLDAMILEKGAQSAATASSTPHAALEVEAVAVAVAAETDDKKEFEEEAAVKTSEVEVQAEIEEKVKVVEETADKKAEEETAAKSDAAAETVLVNDDSPSQEDEETKINRLVEAAKVTLNDGGDPFDSSMVLVRNGSFMMGSTDGNEDESPVHKVNLAAFKIGKYPVTQHEWSLIMGADANPSHFKGDNLPVENISWNDVQLFIRVLNKVAGKQYRLPTEAEWEYAAHGGQNSNNTKYSGSNNADEVAWYKDNSEDKTHPVGMKQANELGLYDMSGNVLEWCQDWKANYNEEPALNPKGPSEGQTRVTRGGCWNSRQIACAVSNRSGFFPSHHFCNLGFRLAIDAPSLYFFSGVGALSTKNESEDVKKKTDADNAGTSSQGLSQSSSFCAGCASSCTSGCSTSCSTSCSSDCSGSCSGGCESGCGRSCSSNCSSGCEGGCSGGCSGGCEGCGGSCSYGCSNTCSGGSTGHYSSGCSGSCSYGGAGGRRRSS